VRTEAAFYFLNLVISTLKASFIFNLQTSFVGRFILQITNNKFFEVFKQKKIEDKIIMHFFNAKENFLIIRGKE
jgi:hypothetical protein